MSAKLFATKSSMWNPLQKVSLLSVVRRSLQILKQRSARVFSLLFAVGFGLSLIVSACSPATTNSTASTTASPASSTQAATVRIGYQKSSTVLNYLRSKGDLDKALSAVRAEAKWTEFPAGPPMLEAMNAGAIDFGFTGETPPVIAQAAGTPLVYIAYDASNPQAEAIVVHKDSPMKSVADLKGKKVAFAKGSNTNYLVVKALESTGLKYTDIQPAFLAPADARAAFENRSVDAWAIWDPYLAVAEEKAGARILVDAAGLAPNRSYYSAGRPFVESRSDLLKVVVEQVKQADAWIAKNPVEVAKFLSPVIGIDAAIIEKAERRRKYGVLPLTDEAIDGQQEIADTFYRLGLIPKQINVKAAV